MSNKKLNPKSSEDWAEVEGQARGDALFDSFEELNVNEIGDAPAASDLIRLAIGRAGDRNREIVARLLAPSALPEFQDRCARIDALRKRLAPSEERLQYLLEKPEMIDRHDERRGHTSYLLERARIYLCGKHGMLPHVFDNLPLGRVSDLLAGDYCQYSKHREPRVPPAGYVGRKLVCNDARFKKHKNPSPTTIDGWVKSAKRNGNPVALEKDPANGENYYPEAWIMEQIATWQPRMPKT